MTLHVRSHFNVLHFLNPILETNSYNPKSLRLSSKSGNFLSFHLVSHRIQIENFIVCARKKNRRSGSQRTTRLLLKSLSLLASNLQILPEPLDLIIAELGGGDGNGGTGFGGWGGFDGWRRKGKRMALWLFLWIILGFSGFCIISGKEIRSEMILPILVFSFVVARALINELKIKAKDLVFGFCCFGALLFFGLKNENFLKLADEIRVFSAGAFLHNRSKRSKRSKKRRHRRN